MLKSVGAGGHYPTNKLQAEEGEEAAASSSMFTMLADNVLGRAQALAETVLLVFYKVYHNHCQSGVIITVKMAVSDCKGEEGKEHGLSNVILCSWGLRMPLRAPGG